MPSSPARSPEAVRDGPPTPYRQDKQESRSRKTTKADRVEKAKADELVRKKSLELEKTKEANLASQIKECKLLAPCDGVVVYGNDPDHVFEPPQIVVGAKVRERQIIVQVRDIDGPMRVNIKVPKATVDRIRPELSARIHVDAFPGQILTGKVEEINLLPDANRLYDQDTTIFYTGRVSVDRGPAGLRPGMAAQVEILVNELENVLTVTRFAVLHFDGKDHVAVKKPDGGFDWREVTLGVSNDGSVEVKQGLRSGEVVIRNPRRLLSAEEKRARSSGYQPRPP